MSGYSAEIIAHRGDLDDRQWFLHNPFDLAILAAKVRETLDNGR